jgi:serine/threonine-protein kinase
MMAPGALVAGKYQVERVLGVGGMGVVLLAHHLELGQRVAIKYLRNELLSDTTMVGRFRREARAAAALQSEHAVRVYDVSPPDAEPPYIVMEYLRGEDLSDILATGGVSIEDAIDYVIQACAAIAEAHAVGIVHRDLKPSNLFLARRRDGTRVLKVLDFGISKISARIAGAVENTTTTSVKGTPTYMSPEQLESVTDLDGRTDVWTLGVILYELLTGRPPFDAETMAQLCVKIISKPHAPPSMWRAGIPPELDAVVGKCLEKDRGKRYPTALAFADALAQFAAPHTRAEISRMHASLDVGKVKLSEPPPPLRSAPSFPEASLPDGDPRLRTQASWARITGRSRRTVRTSLIMMVGFGIIVGIGGALTVIVLSGRAHTPVAAPSPNAASIQPTTEVPLPPSTIVPKPPPTGSAVLAATPSSSAPPPVTPTWTGAIRGKASAVPRHTAAAAGSEEEREFGGRK